MRRESLYLTDILEAADHIGAFIEGSDFEAFQRSEMLRSAVVQKLSIIGEAAGRVSEELRNRRPEVPGPQIICLPRYPDPRLLRDRLGLRLALC